MRLISGCFLGYEPPRPYLRALPPAYAWARLHGYTQVENSNTEIIGFLRYLWESILITMNYEKKICILGAGGFGRETLCCLLDSIATTNRKIEETACFMLANEHYKEPEKRW